MEGQIPNDSGYRSHAMGGGLDGEMLRGE